MAVVLSQGFSSFFGLGTTDPTSCLVGKTAFDFGYSHKSLAFRTKLFSYKANVPKQNKCIWLVLSFQYQNHPMF